MNMSRFAAVLMLTAGIAAAGCSGGGAATTANEQVAVSTANAYTGPAPASADVQAFAVSFWTNVRVQNRCGQCHNATSPAQMPNFARSDDVNLAYAQANTVVNLQQPSTSLIVTKVSGGHNCWLADPNACGQILTTWITNWAGSSVGATGTQVQLQVPPVQTVGQSRNFPASPADFQGTVYPLLSTYCSKCHSPNAATPQSPYFASPDVNQAYQAAIPKMDLNNPTNSRFYERLLTENHNCWSKCADNAAAMLAAIQQFAALEPLTSVDPSLVVSKALTLAQGTVASGANRYDINVIAKYEFQTGTGLTAYDTSGVDPAADLTIAGSVTWAGGWGINVGTGGRAQASTASSKKIYDMLQATGEFTVEAWVAPAVVAADKSYMVSYSGGDTVRNFTLGQTNQDYDFLLRSSTSADLNGMPQLQTPDAAMALQATLQHVVLTYDPVNGRQIYVNGALVPVADATQGATLSNWDPTFALVLGNEVSGDRSWQGLIKFAAIHSRALSADQVKQNYNAGVGQRFYLLFNVADVTAVSQAYVMFTVSQYDSAGYLFSQPTFISLDPTVVPDGIVIKGIHIGINGTLPSVGQAYVPLDTTVTAANYKSTGEVLSSVGTVIAIQSGPLTDQFFLSFDQLGTHTHVTVEALPVAAAPADIPMAASIGVRTFAQINSTLGILSGVSANAAAVSAADMATITSTYADVQQQLPANSTFEGFSSGNQVGIAQMAVAYCNAMVDTPTIVQKMFPGVTFSATLYSSQAGIDSVTSVLAAAVLGVNLQSQPAASTMTGASTGPGTGELDSLITTLCSGSAPCTSPARVQAVTVAACAAAFGSADMLIN